MENKQEAIAKITGTVVSAETKTSNKTNKEYLVLTLKTQTSYTTQFGSTEFKENNYDTLWYGDIHFLNGIEATLVAGALVKVYASLKSFAREYNGDTFYNYSLSCNKYTKFNILQQATQQPAPQPKPVPQSVSKVAAVFAAPNPSPIPQEKQQLVSDNVPF